MKRSIWASLTVMTLATNGTWASAQDFEQPVYEGRLRQYREEQIRKTTADELRFERARVRARQRLQQELANERIGRSTLRPHTNVAYWSLGLGR